MKRIWLVAAGGVAVIMALVAAAFVLVAQLDVKGLLQTAVFEQTGRRLTISGPVRPAFFPTLGVTAGGVALANAPGGASPTLLEADEVRIGVAVRPLLARQLDVTALVFVKPRLSLEIGADGKPNWILAPQKPARPGGAGGDTGVRDVQLAGARIEGGVISYANMKSGMRMGLQDINAVVSLSGLDSPLGLDGTATFNGEKLDVAAKLAAPRVALAGGRSAIAFSFTSAPITTKFNGVIDVRTGGLAGLFEAEGPSLRKLTAWIGAPVGEGPNLQAFKVAGRFELGPKSAAFENATLKLDAIEARGDFLVETGRTKPAISGRLQVAALDLNPYLVTTQPAAASGAPVARIESVDVTSPGWSRAPIDLGGLRAIDANLDLTTGPLTAFNLKMDRAKVDLVLHEGYLAATLSDIGLYGGAGKGRLEVDARTSEVVLRQELDVAGIDAARFLADAAGFTRLEGRSNLKLSLASRGQDQQGLVASTDGSVSLALADGALRGVNLGGVSRTIRSAIGGGMVGPNARTPFKTFSTTFVVSDGVAATDDLRIRAADSEITAVGVIDLSQRTLDMRIRPKADSVLSQIGIAPGAGIAAPFRASGPWSQISYKLDLLGAARDTIAQQVQIVRTRAQMSRDAPK
ncbi:MAG: AsmA family protein [Alphaproteobacteria bacterium]|nr:AsmA family protein [Alphaproteobacteria bacterium]